MGAPPFIDPAPSRNVAGARFSPEPPLQFKTNPTTTLSEVSGFKVQTFKEIPYPQLQKRYKPTTRVDQFQSGALDQFHGGGNIPFPAKA